MHISGQHTQGLAQTKPLLMNTSSSMALEKQLTRVRYLFSMVGVTGVWVMQDLIKEEGIASRAKIDVLVNVEDMSINCECNGKPFFKSPFKFRVLKRPDVKKDGKVLASWRNRVNKSVDKHVKQQFKESMYEIRSVEVKGLI